MSASPKLAGGHVQGAGQTPDRLQVDPRRLASEDVPCSLDVNSSPLSQLPGTPAFAFGQLVHTPLDRHRGTCYPSKGICAWGGWRAAPNRDRIVQALKRGLSAQPIWQDLIEEEGSQGGHLTVQRYVRQLKRVRPEVADRLEHPPGEEAQVDFFKSRPWSATRLAAGAGPESSG